jgi:type II secretory pathway component PulF
MVTPGTLNRRAELYHQLGTAIAAGMPVIKALEMAGNNRALASSRGLILTLTQYLREGHTLSDSFLYAQGKIPGQTEVSLVKKKHKFWMPDFDVALLSVGEETGRLDLIFKMLSAYYATRVKIIRDTIASLLLPAVNLTVFLLVFPLGLLIMFAGGIIDGNYVECLPFIFEKLIVYGGLYGTIFLLIYLCQGTHGESWRSIVESFTRCVPMLRTASKYLVVGRFSAALESLVNAGVPVIRSWKLAGQASASPLLRREIDARVNELDQGLTPAEMVNQIAYFPEMFRNLYLTGEISGQIDDTLARLRDYYQEEGFRTLKLFSRILSGIIYGIIALSIAIYIIHFWIGYFHTQIPE